MNKKQLYEKVMGLVFLLLLIGFIGFLTFVPMPVASEKVILMVIGGLMTVATGALPRLFGEDKSQEDVLKVELENLRTELKLLTAKHEILKHEHDKLTAMLIERHVVKGEGVETHVQQSLS